MVEHRSEKPGVDSSILSLGISLSLFTHKKPRFRRGFLLLQMLFGKSGFQRVCGVFPGQIFFLPFYRLRRKLG